MLSCIYTYMCHVSTAEMCTTVCNNSEGCNMVKAKRACRSYAACTFLLHIAPCVWVFRLQISCYVHHEQTQHPRSCKKWIIPKQLTQYLGTTSCIRYQIQNPEGRKKDSFQSLKLNTNKFYMLKCDFRQTQIPRLWNLCLLSYQMELFSDQALETNCLYIIWETSVINSCI